MSDHFYDNFNTDDTNDISQPVEQETPAPEAAQQESSYEWNSNGSYRNGEYRYSYINGANSDAPHNPNNYENAYSSPSSSDTGSYSSESGYTSQSQYSNPYSSNYSAQNSYQNSYSYSQPSYTAPAEKKTLSKLFTVSALTDITKRVANPMVRYLADENTLWLHATSTVRNTAKLPPA